MSQSTVQITAEQVTDPLRRMLAAIDACEKTAALIRSGVFPPSHEMLYHPSLTFLEELRRITKQQLAGHPDFAVVITKTQEGSA